MRIGLKLRLAALLLVGCTKTGSEVCNNGDAGVPADASAEAGGGSTDGGTDAGGGSTDGGSDAGDGGLVPQDCAAFAPAYCAAYKACAPDLYIYNYENDAICNEVVSDQCNKPVGVPVVNPPNCRAETSASCPATFSTLGMPDCQPMPGKAAKGKPCASTNNCVARLECWVDNPSPSAFGTSACPGGTCVPTVDAGTVCAQQGNTTPNADTGDSCDERGGYVCAWPLNTDTDAGNPIGPDKTSPPTCMRLRLVQLGDYCNALTNVRCGAHLFCAPATNECTPYLEDTATVCDEVNYMCDPVMFPGGCGLSPGASAKTCQAVHVVPIGGTAGPHPDGFTYTCGTYALPDTTSTCRAKAEPPDINLAGLSAICTTSPDDCWATDPKTGTDLQCVGLTCTPVPAPTCN